MKQIVIAAIMVLAFAGFAFAGIPSAATSTVEVTSENAPGCSPSVGVVCPASDMGRLHVTVTVRNVYGDPLPGKTVNCYAQVVSGTFCFCPGETPQVGVTDGLGQAHFYFTDFGGCGTLNFGADCDGVFFNPSPNIYVKSPDNNGDCVVGLVDFANFAAAYTTNNPCYDYNCDGTVNLLDFATFAGHYTHDCPP